MVSFDTELAIVGIALSIIGTIATTVVAVYAIRDARNLVKKSTELQRNISYLRLKNDLMWMFVDPTEGTYSSEIAKGFHDFDVFAKALNPTVKSEHLKEATENEALQSAADLVAAGMFVWKKELNLDAVNKKLAQWAADKSKVKVARLLGVDEL
jgi:hypothetical protein